MSGPSGEIELIIVHACRANELIPLFQYSERVSQLVGMAKRAAIEAQRQIAEEQNSGPSQR